MELELEQRVIELFHETIEAQMTAMEVLAPLIAETSEMITECLLNDNKLIICANGNSAANGMHMSSFLLNRFERDRPSLPALNLATDLASLTAIGSDNGFNEIFAKPIRALGQPGDLLLVISSNGNPGNLVQAIAAAHDREMAVIALNGPQGGAVASLLQPEDIELRAPTHSNTRVREIHFLIINYVCDLLDQQLFGGME